MRCPHCDSPNPDEASSCAQCGQALSTYAPETSANASARAERIYHVSIQPPVVPIVAVLCVFTALLGPFRTAAAALVRRTPLPDEAGGYLVNALGAASGALIAAVMVPIGLFLLVTAFAVWSQRPWAWSAVAVLLCVAGLAAAVTFPSDPLSAVLRIATAGAVAFFWFQPHTRKWYGLE